MAAKVEVVHMSSPLCHWSWGYEPVLNRLEMLYGKQVQFTVGQALPYVERAKWLEDYGMTSSEAVVWVAQAVKGLRLPTWVPKSWEEMPSSCLPAGIAVKAAGIVHGPKAERKLLRHLMNAAFVEGKDTSDEKVLAGIIDSIGLDNGRMIACAQTDAPGNALGEDGARSGHGANFYSLLVRDGQGEGATTVVLEQAYDAARTERAIDYLASKKLKKTKPTLAQLPAYLEENGLVSAQEVMTVFAVDKAKAKASLDRLVKSGQASAKKYPAANATFWSPK